VKSSEQHARFERWLADHAAILHHVARGFAEGADRDDLMQELLLALWNATPAFRAEASPTTFIYRVAHNAALTWKRTLSGYRRRLERFETLAEPAAADPPGLPDQLELLEQVYARIRLLAPLDRSLLLLHLDGMDYATMAEIHGLTESNVGARLTRLRQKLTASLQDISHELR
jgi:RNA polymerase sigma factor (sigma-70 family)